MFILYRNRSILERILADTTYNYLAQPLTELFIKEMRSKDEIWAKGVVDMLHAMTGQNPKYFEIKIDDENAYALSLALGENDLVTFEDIKRSRSNREQFLHLSYLLLKRGDQIYLLPDEQMRVELGDECLIVADDESKDDFEYIINNIYELDYVLGRQSDELFHFFKRKKK
jgi:hypothetical protein